MFSLIPCAIVAMATVTQARFLRLGTQNDTMQCCPCPTSSLGQTEATATVTVTQPKETVTVECTVTEHETTVFVTQTQTPIPAAPSVVTQVVTVQPQPLEKIVTPVDESPNSPEQQQPQTITKTIQLGGGPSQPSEAPGVVTVTFNPQQPAGPSRPTGDQGVVTETVLVGAQPKEFHTVFVDAEPSVKTVTFVNNEPSTKVKTLPQATVSAPPQTETVVKSVDNYTTLTKTVSTGGPNNIEITIINIITGETTCRKENGEPCDSGPHGNSTMTPCPTGILTRTATAFNTVVVTMSQGMGLNATNSQGNSMASKPRVPLIRRKL